MKGIQNKTQNGGNYTPHYYGHNKPNQSAKFSLKTLYNYSAGLYIGESKLQIYIR